MPYMHISICLSLQAKFMPKERVYEHQTWRRYINHFNRCAVKVICFKLTLLNLTQGVYQTYGSLRNCSPPEEKVGPNTVGTISCPNRNFCVQGYNFTVLITQDSQFNSSVCYTWFQDCLNEDSSECTIAWLSCSLAMCGTLSSSGILSHSKRF